MAIKKRTLVRLRRLLRSALQGRAANSPFRKPAITPNFYCPHCGKLLPFGANKCKYCLEEIDAERAEFNTAINFVLTQAISHANIISGFDPGVVVFIVVTVMNTFWLKQELYSAVPKIWITFEIISSLIWFLPIANIIYWFYAYGRWNVADDEYAAKKKDMRLSLRMWIAAYAFHLVLIFAF